MAAPLFHQDRRIVGRLENTLNDIIAYADLATDDGRVVPQVDGPPILAGEPAAGRLTYHVEQVYHKSWKQLRKTPLFLHEPANGFAYYLMATQSTLGVEATLWRRALGIGPRDPIERYFRVWELLDVTGRPTMHRADRPGASRFITADLTSRDVRKDVVIPLDDAARPVWPLNFQPNNALFQFNSMVKVIAKIIKSYLSNKPLVVNQYTLTLVIAMPGVEALGGHIVVLTFNRPFDPTISYTKNAYGLLKKAAKKALLDRYEQNGVHFFSVRALRIFDRTVPALTLHGNPYNPPPNLFFYGEAPTTLQAYDKGGCLNMKGFPGGLVDLVGDILRTISVDVDSYLFDNNCGLRELLLYVDRFADLLRKGDYSGLFRKAAEMRAFTFSNMKKPPSRFDKLSFDEILAHLDNPGEIGLPRAEDVCLVRLASPENPYTEQLRGPNLRNMARVIGSRTPILVLGYGHYFGIARRFNQENVAEKVDRLLNVSYCKRCLRYYDREGGNRVLHYGQPNTPDEQYKECNLAPASGKTSEMLKWQVPIGMEAPPDWVDDEDIHLLHRHVPPTPFSEQPPILKEVKPLLGYMLTKLSHVGFMDLETWRPEDNDDYHSVYAVGLILHTTTDVSIKDVETFSILDDEGLDGNDVLTAAFSRVIKHIVRHEKKYTKKKPYYIWFYNGSGFDNLFVLNCLIEKMEMYADNMVYKDGKLMQLTYLGGRLIIKDLFLFTICSLDAACKLYKLPQDQSKTSLDHDSITSVEKIREKWETIDHYLRHDLVALAHVYLKASTSFHRVFGLDISNHITLPQISFNYWVSTLSPQLRKQIIIPSYDLYKRLQPSYYGGRVFPQVQYWISDDYGKPYEEVEDHVICDDDVSLYPTSMTEAETFVEELQGEEDEGDRHWIPSYFYGEPEDADWIMIRRINSLLKNHKRILPKDEDDYYINRHIRRLLRMVGLDPNKGYIVNVDIKVGPEVHTTILPHKNDKGHTAWDALPHKKQSYVLEELLCCCLISDYEVTQTHEALIFPHRSRIFNESIGSLMTLKNACNDDDPDRQQYKGGANSTYGKMAQEIIDTNTTIIPAHQLEDFMLSNKVISIEPLADDFLGRQKMKDLGLNKPIYSEFSSDLSEEVTRPQGIGVRSFVVTYSKKKATPTKPFYIGCQVTAYSRFHMNVMMKILGLLEKPLYGSSIPDLYQLMFYQDTDSIWYHVSRRKLIPEKWKKILFGKQTGQLSDELKGGKVIRWASLAPKTYTAEYIMPNGKVYQKVCAKGFPHTKQHVELDDFEIHDYDRYLDSKGEKVDSRKLKLKQYVYEVEDMQGSKSLHQYLGINIFVGLLKKAISKVTVHFTSMKKEFFGFNETGGAAGIHHSFMSRSLANMPFWNGIEAFESQPVEPASRKRYCDNHFGTVPIGHKLYLM